MCNCEEGYRRWIEGLKRAYHELGFDNVEIVGDILYPTAYDKFIGIGYDLRKAWEGNEELKL